MPRNKPSPFKLPLKPGHSWAKLGAWIRHWISKGSLARPLASSSFVPASTLTDCKVICLPWILTSPVACSGRPSICPCKRATSKSNWLPSKRPDKRPLPLTLPLSFGLNWLKFLASNSQSTPKVVPALPLRRTRFCPTSSSTLFAVTILSRNFNSPVALTGKPCTVPFKLATFTANLEASNKPCKRPLPVKLPVILGANWLRSFASKLQVKPAESLATPSNWIRFLPKDKTNPLAEICLSRIRTSPLALIGKLWILPVRLSIFTANREPSNKPVALPLPFKSPLILGTNWLRSLASKTQLKPCFSSATPSKRIWFLPTAKLRPCAANSLFSNLSWPSARTGKSWTTPSKRSTFTLKREPSNKPRKLPLPARLPRKAGCNWTSLFASNDQSKPFASSATPSNFRWLSPRSTCTPWALSNLSWMRTLPAALIG